LTGVGVEVEFKVYSPNITSIEVVKRREKVPKYTRLYYMRQAKHDPGSLEGVVRNYLRQRGALAGKIGGVDLGKGKGKKR
jgi:large subunit ribosomal protein L19